MAHHSKKKEHRHAKKTKRTHKKKRATQHVTQIVKINGLGGAGGGGSSSVVVPGPIQYLQAPPSAPSAPSGAYPSVPMGFDPSDLEEQLQDRLQAQQTFFGDALDRLEGKINSMPLPPSTRAYEELLAHKLQEQEGMLHYSLTHMEQRMRSAMDQLRGPETSAQPMDMEVNEHHEAPMLPTPHYPEAPPPQPATITQNNFHYHAAQHPGGAGPIVEEPDDRGGFPLGGDPFFGAPPLAIKNDASVVEDHPTAEDIIDSSDNSEILEAWEMGEHGPYMDLSDDMDFDVAEPKIEPKTEPARDLSQIEAKEHSVLQAEAPISAPQTALVPVSREIPELPPPTTQNALTAYVPPVSVHHESDRSTLTVNDPALYNTLITEKPYGPVKRDRSARKEQQEGRLVLRAGHDHLLHGSAHPPESSSAMANAFDAAFRGEIVRAPPVSDMTPEENQMMDEAFTDEGRPLRGGRKKHQQ